MVNNEFVLFSFVIESNDNYLFPIYV